MEEKSVTSHQTTRHWALAATWSTLYRDRYRECQQKLWTWCVDLRSDSSWTKCNLHVYHHSTSCKKWLASCCFCIILLWWCYLELRGVDRRCILGLEECKNYPPPITSDWLASIDRETIFSQSFAVMFCDIRKVFVPNLLCAVIFFPMLAVGVGSDCSVLPSLRKPAPIYMMQLSN